MGELEDQMKQMGEEVVQKHQDLLDQIAGLHAEIEQWKAISDGWKKDCEQARRMLDLERQSKQHLELQIQVIRENANGSTEAVPIKPRARRQLTVSDKQSNGHQHGLNSQGEGLEDLTCGNCSNDTRCQCIEEAFELNDIATGPADPGSIKRTLSPQHSRDVTKRVRPNTEDIEDASEIDFTTRRPLSLPKGTSSLEAPSTSAVDSCGFCQDGTACICAEISRHNEAEKRSQQTSTRITRKQASNFCTKDPGNCAQCQAIPESKDFCTTLAASRSAAFDTSNDHASTSRSTGTTLNCAEAFNRLAQHPNYPQASTQLKTWVPQLATRAVNSNPTSHSSSLEQRPAFEIEAASVMNVLKLFDVRFGDQQDKTGD